MQQKPSQILCPLYNHETEILLWSLVYDIVFQGKLKDNNPKFIKQYKH